MHKLPDKFGSYLHPYIIAEIGVNHGGDLPLAKRLIESAHAGGAHAAKFQTYKAGLIARKESPAYWDTTKETATSQYTLFQRYDGFGPEEYSVLADHCRQVGIDFMSTPFDLGAVDFLDSMMDLFKIASADITNVPLLRAVASKGKPVVLSTGAATLPEIEFAVETLESAGAVEIGLLHCVLNYPTALESAQLNTISILKRVFPDVSVGYSDHTVPTQGMEVLTTASLLGATILEKHFTHDKTLPGNDHYHAMNEEELIALGKAIVLQRTVIGAETKQIQGEAEARLYARRSLVAARDLCAGSLLRSEDLNAKRPGDGISPVHWDEVIGSRLTRDVPMDSALEWSDIRQSQ
jgi:N-acetylneuraminate synthase